MCLTSPLVLAPGDGLGDVLRGLAFAIMPLAHTREFFYN
jgi:hypothetical protein